MFQLLSVWSAFGRANSAGIVAGRCKRPQTCHVCIIAPMSALPSPSRRAGLWPGLALALVFGIGLALRLAHLGSLPLGLHHDEGYNALDALDILHGARPVFLPGNFGREPLFIYLQALPINAFGLTPWAVRLPAALVGGLTILAQYLFVQALPLPRPRLAALISAALLAVSFWPVAKAHQGLRAGMLPLWVALALWAWWRAVGDEKAAPRRRWAWAASSGVFVAASLYTHTNGRLLPVILALSALWVAGASRSWRPLGTLAVALVVAALITLPLLVYFRANPDMLGLRAGQVSILNPDVNGGNLVGALVDNAARLALMPIVRGTESAWENLPGRPVFDPLIAGFFVVGLALLLADLIGRRGRVAQSAAVLVIAALAVMLIPSWLSDGAPHYGRLTGIWPTLFLLPAWGLVGLADWLQRRGTPWLAWGLVTLAVIASGILSTRDVFGPYAASPEIHDVYRGAAIRRGEQVASLVAVGPTYVTPGVWNQTPVRMVNDARPPRSFDPRHGLVLPPSGGARYVFETWEAKDAAAFASRWAGMEREPTPAVPPEAQLLVYRLPDAAQPPVAGALTAPPTFGDAIRLQGATVTPDTLRPGQGVDVTLDWLALQPTPSDVNFFVHVVGADGRLIGQFDGPPLGGSYPTTDWRPGERILQTVSVPIKADTPPGEAAVRVGWYDWRDGQRLPVPSAPDSAPTVGRLTMTH